MDTSEKIAAFFGKEQLFKEAIGILRELAHKTELQESYKWGAPIYTFDNKNVLGIMAFKNHFGIWFYNGVFLKDPKKVLVNSQEGKTKAMRHWKFFSIDDIDQTAVLAYMNEAIENQKKGLVWVPDRQKETVVPELLQNTLNKNSKLKDAFKKITPYKQREFCEYIKTAKQEKTKLSRLEKIIPLIEQGMGLHDAYR